MKKVSRRKSSRRKIEKSRTKLFQHVFSVQGTYFYRWSSVAIWNEEWSNEHVRNTSPWTSPRQRHCWSASRGISVEWEYFNFPSFLVHCRRRSSTPVWTESPSNCHVLTWKTTTRTTWEINTNVWSLPPKRLPFYSTDGVFAVKLKCSAQSLLERKNKDKSFRLSPFLCDPASHLSLSWKKSNKFWWKTSVCWWN